MINALHLCTYLEVTENGAQLNENASFSKWSHFVQEWWQTACVTTTAMVLAGCSVVWTLHMAAKDCEEVSP